MGMKGIKVTFYGKGGGGGGIYTLHHLIRKMKSENYRPKVVLEIGGNDLDKKLFSQDSFLQKRNIIILELKNWGMKEIGIPKRLRFRNTNLIAYANGQ